MADTPVAVTLLTVDALSVRIDGTTPGAAMTSVASGATAVIACSGWTRNRGLPQHLRHLKGRIPSRPL